MCSSSYFFFFFQAEDGIRDYKVTGVQTCALPIYNVRAALRINADDPAGRGHQKCQVSVTAERAIVSGFAVGKLQVDALPGRRVRHNGSAPVQPSDHVQQPLAVVTPPPDEGGRVRGWLRREDCLISREKISDRKSTRLNSSHLVIS